jgi:glycosyltransferase involved in cell wall biosynthesis
MENERSLKILRIITRLNIGGPAQHVVFLTEGLNSGLFHSKLTFGAIDSNEGDMSYLAQAKGIAVEEVACLRNGAGLLRNLQAVLQLYRLIRREKPNVVHLHLLKARFLAGVAAKAARVPLILETFHGDLFSDYYGYLKTQAILMAERFLGHLIMDRVVAISQRVKENVIRHHVAPARKIEVVPLGLELDQFRRCSVARGELRQELGIDAEERLVGMVGRMVPIKGHSYFLQAAREVLLAYPRVRFVLVGDGHLRRDLELECRRLGIDRSVIFLGWRRDLGRIYADLDIVALSSLNEGTPVSLIEAMAAGRATVATNVGGVSDVVEDGVTGLLVPSKQSRALAGAILRLLQDDALRETLGKRAMASVYPKYDVSRLIEDTKSLYLNLLQAQDRGS